MTSRPSQAKPGRGGCRSSPAQLALRQCIAWSRAGYGARGWGGQADSPWETAVLGCCVLSGLLPISASVRQKAVKVFTNAFQACLLASAEPLGACHMLALLSALGPTSSPQLEDALPSAVLFSEGCLLAHPLVGLAHKQHVTLCLSLASSCLASSFLTQADTDGWNEGNCSAGLLWL